MIQKIKNLFKRKEFPEKKAPIQIDNTLAELQEQVNSEKIKSLALKVAEQEIIIRRLLDLVIMNIEHKDYSKHLLGQIHKVKNLLDKPK